MVEAYTTAMALAFVHRVAIGHMTAAAQFATVGAAHAALVVVVAVAVVVAAAEVAVAVAVAVDVEGCLARL